MQRTSRGKFQLQTRVSPGRTPLVRMRDVKVYHGLPPKCNETEPSTRRPDALDHDARQVDRAGHRDPSEIGYAYQNRPG